MNITRELTEAIDALGRERTMREEAIRKMIALQIPDGATMLANVQGGQRQPSLVKMLGVVFNYRPYADKYGQREVGVTLRIQNLNAKKDWGRGAIREIPLDYVVEVLK